MKTWLAWSTVIENLGIFMFVLTVRVNYWLILCFWNIFPFFVVDFCLSTVARWRSRHFIVVATLGPRWVEL